MMSESFDFVMSLSGWLHCHTCELNFSGGSIPPAFVKDDGECRFCGGNVKGAE